MRSHSTFRPDTFEYALQAAGWTCQSGVSSWRRKSESGVQRLRQLDGRGHWRHFELSANVLPTVKKRAILAANAQLDGPAKFALTSTATVGCRVDVPEAVDWVAQAELGYDDHAASDPPFATFVRAIESVIEGTPTDATANLSMEPTADALRDAGYAVSVEGQLLQIHVNYGGVYRQIQIESGGVSAEIVKLAGYGAASRRSALLLIHEANQRLPLVRFSLQNNAVVAEVRWAATPIPAAWLHVSIACVDAAIALTARELEAVRNPQLGEVVLALSGA